MTYRPGQVAAIFPHVHWTPEWFLLGGPADGDEAQCVSQRWPAIEILAVEPVATLRAWQLAHGFPNPDRLLPCALSDRCGFVEMLVPPDGRRASILRDCGGQQVRVETITLEQLSRMYGPFRRALLWLDIEGAEPLALTGADEIFRARAIDLVNVEVMPAENPEGFAAVEGFLSDHGLVLVEQWNPQGTHHDRIYVRKELATGVRQQAQDDTAESDQDRTRWTKQSPPGGKPRIATWATRPPERC